MEASGSAKCVYEVLVNEEAWIGKKVKSLP
jgi:hypothetical protein